jgi:hypothetical protein
VTSRRNLTFVNELSRSSTEIGRGGCRLQPTEECALYTPFRLRYNLARRALRHSPLRERNGCLPAGW